MALKLYVDKKQLPTSKTEIKGIVEYNCKAISPEFMDSIMQNLLNTGNTSTFFTVGRYFCFVSIQLEKNFYQMIFADLNNNDETFYKVLQGGFGKPDKQLRENAILVFNRLKLQYEKNYNDVELVEGEPLIE